MPHPPWPIGSFTVGSEYAAPWLILTGVAVVGLVVSGLRLRMARVSGRPRTSAISLVAATISALLLVWLNGSPSRWTHRSMSGQIALAEEMVRRYELYRAEHGRYPTSIDAIYFEALDAFDEVNERQNTSECDGYGTGCNALRIHAVDEPQPELFLQLHLGTIECSAKTVDPVWRCWDHF
jgi:hypothetical protein